MDFIHSLLDLLVAEAPEVAGKYEDVLREVLATAGRGRRDPLLDGQVVVSEEEDGGVTVAAMGGPEHPSIADYHAIRAALLLHTLDPEDASVVGALRRWSEEHPDAGVRKQLAEQLAGGAAKGREWRHLQ